MKIVESNNEILGSCWYGNLEFSLSRRCKTKLYMMKNKMLLFFLLCLIAGTLTGQQVNVENLLHIGKNTPLTFNGGLSAGSVLYGGNPQQGRQDWTYYLNGNLNVSIYGQINIPVSLNITNLGANISYPSLPNRFSLHPTYKWITAHIGDVAMTFSPYILNGHQFTGGGVELTPEKFKISAMGGQLLRKVNFDSSTAYIMPNYQRMGYGLKAEYDGQNYAFGATYFTAKDRKDDANRILFDSLGIHPMQNMALGVNTRLNLISNFTLTAEYAVSYLTQNIYAPTQYNNLIDRIITRRTSTNTYHAFNMKITYQFLKNSVGISYERIDPNYQTLGAYYFNNDYENITLNYARPFFKNDKANITINFGVQRDNLNHNKEQSTNRYVGAVALTYAPSEKFQSSLNYSTFQSFRNVKSQFDYINATSPYQNLDTLNFSQLSQNMDASLMYILKKTDKQNQRVNLNMSYMESADRQGDVSMVGNVSRFVNAGLLYSISFIPQNINTNLSLNTSYNYGGGIGSYTLGPTLGISANLFKKTLMTGFSTSYNVNIHSRNLQAQILNLRANVSYRVKKKHQLNASFIWQNRNITNQIKTDILTTTVSYAYTF